MGTNKGLIFGDSGFHFLTSLTDSAGKKFLTWANVQTLSPVYPWSSVGIEAKIYAWMATCTARETFEPWEDWKDLTPNDVAEGWSIDQDSNMLFYRR